MKLILASEGFYTQKIAEACARLCGKPLENISFAVINEAYTVVDGDKRWVLKNLNDLADKFGGDVDLVNLRALSLDEVEQRIKSKDAIFVIGGDPDYLMGVFIKTGFDKLLPKLLKTKVYVGSSAGAMILGKRLTDQAYKKIYGLKNTYGTTKYLELVAFSIMPHMHSPQFPNRKEKLKAVIGDHKDMVYGLRDDCAVIVENDKVTTVGSAPYLFNRK